MNTRTILTALALAAVLSASCAAPSSSEPEISADVSAIVAEAVDGYAGWLAENPTGTFEEYKPTAIVRLLASVGVPYVNDPEATFIEWLGDTPVEARHLRRATLIVLAKPELADYRVVIAQLFARLELAE